MAALAICPADGYRRVRGTLWAERQSAGVVPFDAKRGYRVMSSQRLPKQQRPAQSRAQRGDDDKVAMARSNPRWFSMASSFGATTAATALGFALNCCDGWSQQRRGLQRDAHGGGKSLW